MMVAWTAEDQAEMERQAKIARDAPDPTPDELERIYGALRPDDDGGNREITTDEGETITVGRKMTRAGREVRISDGDATMDSYTKDRTTGRTRHEVVTLTHGYKIHNHKLSNIGKRDPSKVGVWFWNDEDDVKDFQRDEPAALAEAAAAARPARSEVTPTTDGDDLDERIRNAAAERDRLRAEEARVAAARPAAGGTDRELAEARARLAELEARNAAAAAAGGAAAGAAAARTGEVHGLTRTERHWPRPAWWNFPERNARNRAIMEERRVRQSLPPDASERTVFNNLSFSTRRMLERYNAEPSRPVPAGTHFQKFADLEAYYASLPHADTLLKEAGRARVRAAWELNSNRFREAEQVGHTERLIKIAEHWKNIPMWKKLAVSIGIVGSGIAATAFAPATAIATFAWGAALTWRGLSVGMTSAVMGTGAYGYMRKRNYSRRRSALIGALTAGVTGLGTIVGGQMLGQWLSDLMSGKPNVAAVPPPTEAPPTPPAAPPAAEPPPAAPPPTEPPPTPPAQEPPPPRPPATEPAPGASRFITVDLPEGSSVAKEFTGQLRGAAADLGLGHLERPDLTRTLNATEVVFRQALKDTGTWGAVLGDSYAATPWDQIPWRDLDPGTKINFGAVWDNPQFVERFTNLLDSSRYRTLRTNIGGHDAIGSFVEKLRGHFMRV